MKPAEDVVGTFPVSKILKLVSKFVLKILLFNLKP